MASFLYRFSYLMLSNMLEELTHWKDPEAGKDWGQEEKGATGDEMVGWHHQLNGNEFEQTLGDSEGQGSLACYSLWCCKESDTAVTGQRKHAGGSTTDGPTFTEGAWDWDQLNNLSNQTARRWWYLYFKKSNLLRCSLCIEKCSHFKCREFW